MLPSQYLFRRWQKYYKYKNMPVSKAAFTPHRKYVARIWFDKKWVSVRSQHWPLAPLMTSSNIFLLTHPDVFYPVSSCHWLCKSPKTFPVPVSAPFRWPTLAHFLSDVSWRPSWCGSNSLCWALPLHGLTKGHIPVGHVLPAQWL